MKKKHGIFFGFSSLLIAAMFILAGCGDSGSGDPTTPPGGDPPIISIAFQNVLYTVTGTTSSDLETVEVKVEKSGVTLSGETVNWSITSPGGTNGAALSVTSSNTDASGIASVTVSGANVRREVTITATPQSDNSKTATATVRFGDPLPSGFLALFVAPVGSSSTKNWADAVTFCEQQGGRLPRINGAIALGSGEVSSGDPVDGFGTLGGPWPSGLPSNFYWTGTESSSTSGISRYINESGGTVNYNQIAQTQKIYVVCVPLP
jgi:hypothetical protein